MTDDDVAVLVECKACLFWDSGTGSERACRRHAPAATDQRFEVARWPETRATDGCGEGQPLDAPKRARQQCEGCAFWLRPGIGIDPGQRGDHLRAWWQKAGYCCRFAPRPGPDIGVHAFWRATHASDYCFDGRPK